MRLSGSFPKATECCRAAGQPVSSARRRHLVIEQPHTPCSFRRPWLQNGWTRQAEATTCPGRAVAHSHDGRVLSRDIWTTKQHWSAPSPHIALVREINHGRKACRMPGNLKVSRSRKKVVRYISLYADSARCYPAGMDRQLGIVHCPPYNIVTDYTLHFRNVVRSAASLENQFAFLRSPIGLGLHDPMGHGSGSSAGVDAEMASWLHAGMSGREPKWLCLARWCPGKGRKKGEGCWGC